MSYLTNVNNHTRKKYHLWTFSIEIIFTKLVILTLIRASSLMYFINDMFRSVIFEHFILKIIYIYIYIYPIIKMWFFFIELNNNKNVALKLNWILLRKISSNIDIQ